MINIIYGLRDPRNDVYQYIGKSTIGTERALSHLTHSHSKLVNDWVADLETKWLCPLVDIIEEVKDLKGLAGREKYWINYYCEINPNLLNIQLVQHPFQNIKNDEDDEKFNALVRIMSDIPNILKQERMCRNLTQDDLAREANMSRSTISLCERGLNVNLSVVQKYIRTLKGYDIISKSYKQRARNKRKNLQEVPF